MITWIGGLGATPDSAGVEIVRGQQRTLNHGFSP